MTTDKLREILHSFGLTYKVESKEERLESISHAKAEIVEWAMEVVKKNIVGTFLDVGDFNDGWQRCRSEILKRLEEIK